MVCTDKKGSRKLMPYTYSTKLKFRKALKCLSCLPAENIDSRSSASLCESIQMPIQVSKNQSVQGRGWR